MKNKFQLFSQDGNHSLNKPKAAEEHKIEIAFHNQNNTLTTGDTPILGFIIGYMTNEFSYSSTGNYKNVWDIAWSGDSMPAKLLSDESQKNFFNYGYATKKMFSNGEAPSINISFTCYAGDDMDNNTYILDRSKNMSENNPIYVAQLLIAATLPQVSTSNAFLATNFEEAVKDSAGAIGNVVKTVVKAGTDFLSETATGQPIEGAQKAVKEIAATVLDSITSNKPPVCNLKIGNIFEKDMMVIRKVDAVMSKEYLRPGVPLYGKFDVTFESLFNAANLIGGDDAGKEKIFGTGLKINNGGSRVTFQNVSPNAGGGGGARQGCEA
jgi:hypothetical protein